MIEDTNKLTVVLTGGGTGGHIYPAIAIYERLLEDSDIKKIVYIGCEKNMEKKTAETYGIEFHSVEMSGMPRKPGIQLLKWFITLNVSTINAFSLLKKIKPDVILGTGGYVSAPVLFAGKILNIPFGIHDPDANPGIVNKFMSKWASFVSLSFEKAAAKMKSKKISINGNPLRKSFSAISKEEALNKLNLDATKKTLLVIGGSQGAKSINNAILKGIQTLLDSNIQIIHQVGAKNFEQYKTDFENTNGNLKETTGYIAQPFFDNMPDIMAASDIAISRAGSLSISELNLNGLPSILVPYPYAAADHQKHNAQAMEAAGASVFIEDSELDENTLIKNVLELINSDIKIENMKQANLKLAKPDAADKIIELLKIAAKNIISN